MELGRLSDGELRDTLTERMREFDRLTCEVAQLAAAAHQRGVGDELGQVSTAKWMEWATGTRAPEAQRLIRAGLALEHLPLVRAAWASGELSASAAQMICRGRHADHGDEYGQIEAMLVELGKGHWFAEMHTVIARYRQCIETEPQPRRGLHVSETPDGWQLDASLSKLDGALVNEAIASATPPPAEGDDRTAAQRRADALVTIARHYLDHGDATVADAKRSPNVHTVLDWATLTGTVSGMPDMPIPQWELGKLLCDCAITRVITGPDGRPLDVGRTTRLGTPAQRSAILVRDRHCRYPGCDRPPKWCELHHVNPWEHGGPTDLDNLVLLCSHHHHVVHKPGWTATFNGHDFRVTNPNGHVMTSRARAPAAV